jgi:hypothetical protein
MRYLTTKHRDHVALVMLSGVLLAALPVLAHHSFTAEFNPDKEWSVTGVLTKVDWVNPHTATWFDVKDEKIGQVETLGCQGNPPGTYSQSENVPQRFVSSTQLCKQASQLTFHLRMS